MGHERGRIEIGDVVGHEDAGAAGGNVFAAFDVNADAGDADGDAGDPGAGGIERADVAGEKRERKEDHRRGNGENDDGDEDEERDDHAVGDLDGCAEVSIALTVVSGQ